MAAADPGRLLLRERHSSFLGSSKNDSYCSLSLPSPELENGVVVLPSPWRALADVRESGQAWVYRVGRDGSEGDFALKRLKNPRRRARFTREVRVMERLLSTGCKAIPPIVASDLETERPWYAMRWYEEGSLEELIRSGGPRNDIRRALTLVRALASALADVHAGGVAHRDLKPGNVLLERDGVLLADFGLCLELDDPEARLTDVEEAVGSRLYVAPENEAGINEEADQRPADFYAFGKILWSVFSGRQPLPRERVLEPEHLLTRMAGDERLRTLDGLVRDLLNRDPRVRLHDWEVVIQELAAFEALLAGGSASRPRDVRKDVVAVARRLRDAPEVVASRNEQESAVRRELWLSSLVRRMHQEARRIELSVGELVAALGGVLTVAATTGSAPSRTILQSFDHDYDEVIGGMTPAISRGDIQAIVLIVHSPDGVEAFPTIAVRIWPAQIGGRLLFISVPTISPAQELERACLALRRWFLRTSGPYAELRQATVDEAGRFIEGIARLFVAFVEQYIFAVEAGLDPGDEGTWEGRDLLPVDLSTNRNELADTRPPDLRSFELIPDALKLGPEGGVVVCRARLVDDLAGVHYTGSVSQARLRSPSGQFLDVMFNEATRTTGDALDGVYEDEFRFLGASERGRWVIEYVLAVDRVGNERRYTTSELRELCFACEMAVR